MKGGLINGVFHTIGQAKIVNFNLVNFRKHFLYPYSGKRRLPLSIRQYLKVLDSKIEDSEKIIKKYG